MNKRGSVEILFLMLIITVLIILSFTFYIIYVQIVTYVIPIKQDLFYIVQNAYFSLNQESLEYADYVVNNNELKNKIDNVLKNNYMDCSIKTVYYNYEKNNVYIEVTINITPVVFRGYINSFNLIIKDEIKLKTLEVK